MPIDVAEAVSDDHHRHRAQVVQTRKSDVLGRCICHPGIGAERVGLDRMRLHDWSRDHVRHSSAMEDDPVA